MTGDADSPGAPHRMPDAPAAGGGPGDRPSADDRRVRTGLRALVDEMMAQLRLAAASDAWTDEERARAEADLARIMGQVRDETFRGRDGA